MGRISIENQDLLKLIEKGLTAKQICKKVNIDRNTLKRRHHMLMINLERYIPLQGLQDDKTTIKRKKSGIVLTNQVLKALQIDEPNMEYKATKDKDKIILTKIKD